MQFSSPLVQGTLIKRYKRFLADIQLDSSALITAHCPNTGAMTGCAIPDSRVFLSPSTNPKRKLAYTWELALTPAGHWIGINTQNANKLIHEGIANGTITGFDHYSEIRTEVKYGNENSRIDLLLTGESQPDCYIEVKSVTLLEQGDKGYFPDAKTERGQKHLRELIEMVQQGYRAVLMFCVQHSGIQSVSPAAHIDPLYTDILHQAVAAGVEIQAWGCHFDDEKISINQKIKVIL